MSTLQSFNSGNEGAHVLQYAPMSSHVIACDHMCICEVCVSCILMQIVKVNETQRTLGNVDLSVHSILHVQVTYFNKY